MSYTLKYTGSEIDDILDRAVAGGTIDTELAGKQDVLTFDDAPTAGSSNPVKSGGIFDALAEKLDADGVAVTAKAILGGTPTTDTAPFLYRLNPYGNRVRPCIVGVSVGANQLVDTNTTSVTLTSGHKYAKYASGAWSIGASTGAAISVNGSNGDMLIDITLRFGSAIADAAYTKEQSVAGSGIAWLRSYGLLPEGYEAYNAESIKSVNTSGRRTKNADESVVLTYPTEATDLRGVLKLSGDTIYADGDLYPPSGEGTRKYGVVDMGDLSWTYMGDPANMRFKATPTTAAKIYSASSVVPNAVCSNYKIDSYTAIYGGADKVCGIGMDANIYVRDTAYSDAATFKTAMSGVYLVYELATPTSETLTPYTEIQQALTTEEWLSSEVPVGQSSDYYKDIVSAIEGIPEAPSANGTYTLKVTVSGGVATYSWEA